MSSQLLDGGALDLAQLQSQFDRLHEQHYAHSQPGYPVQIVNYRVSAVSPTLRPQLRELPASSNGGNALKERRSVYFDQGANFVDCPIYHRDRLVAGESIDGPAVVEEWTSTTVVPPHWRSIVDRFGNLVLSMAEGEYPMNQIDPITTEVIRNAMVALTRGDEVDPGQDRL